MTERRGTLELRPRTSGLFDVLVLVVLVSAFACTTMRAIEIEAVAEDASLAHARAQQLFRSSRIPERGSDREEARAEAERAVRLAPDWIAPQRLLDDLMREELLGLEALSVHHAALRENPSDAQALYLAGRLEGRRGAGRFARAAEADSRLSWGHHGLAWEASRVGRLSDAIRHGKQALVRARDPWERAFFMSSLARYELSSGNPQAAVGVLDQALSDPGLLEGQRIGLRVQLATTELELSARERMRGYRRALELLRREQLTDDEVERLAERVRRFALTSGVSLLELQSALADQDGRVRDRLRAELLLDEAPTPLALGLLERSLSDTGELENGGALLRVARFAAGQFPEAVDQWLASLPRVVLDENGEPRDTRLKTVIDAARALETDGLVQVEIAALLTRLGDATIDAGWFRESRSVATELAAYDLEAALDLESRALAGLELVQGLRRLVYRVDESERDESGTGTSSIPGKRVSDIPELSEVDSANVEDLDGLLVAMGPMFARAHERLGGDANPDGVSRSLKDSPRMDYGFVGGLVHPGPRFSAEDENLGRGSSRARVPGLAREMNQIGRFGLFGQVVGTRPDGSMLKLLLTDERGGEHLGVKWFGTIAWCEGADILARAGRLGASIAGAALHEGYWVDIEVLRRDLATWSALRRRFSESGMGARVDCVLETRGIPLGKTNDRARYRQNRRSAQALLGESDRMRLAVLRDRRSADGELGRITLDELVEVTATHEQGHLCDRERYLPLSDNFESVVRLVFSGNFSPQGVQRRLEYRAQLLALCEVTDPRVALSDILRAAEGGGSVTPHASAYSSLLDDLLLYLDRDLEKEPEAWEELDPDFTLVHQLHHLPPEKVRRLALKLAEKRDLVR